MIKPHHGARIVHFIGIGGVGMSAIAEMLHIKGFVVSGSDKAISPITKHLEKIGVAIQYSHAIVHVAQADIVVYSSAIRKDNPEWAFAHQAGKTLVRRAEMLGDLMRAYQTVCISGTHGKTTTTSLVGKMFADCGYDPTILVGGIPRDGGSNARVGESDILVAEADEYDRSFLAMVPTTAVVTNIEEEHLDCYANLAQIEDAFVQFLNTVPFYGAIIACIDNPTVVRVLARVNKRTITYGISQEAMICAKNIVAHQGGSRFVVSIKGENDFDATITIPGVHNVQNSLAAIGVAHSADIPYSLALSSIGTFSGVKRRFEKLTEHNGIQVFDDYAHHPTEIRATLDAARCMSFTRVVVAFQPHLYTRTRDFMQDFITAFEIADKVFVLPIYKSREEPIAGISSETIVDGINATTPGKALSMETPTDLLAQVNNFIRTGDCVLFLGAGDITEMAHRFSEELAHV